MTALARPAIRPQAARNAATAFAADVLEGLAATPKRLPAKYFYAEAGSSIGNLEPPEVPGFLRRAKRALGQAAAFVVGVDLVKDPEVLYAAYNDSQGVTAQFNRNLLVRINRELGADFDVSAFEHHA